MRILYFLVLLFISVFPGKLLAQETGSGLDFLNVGPSAGLLAINEAGTAALIGTSSIYTNPAMLAFEPQSSAEVNYTSWISEVNNQYGAVNLKSGKYAIAAGVYSSNADNFEARDVPGPSQGTFSIRYLSIAGSLARNFGPVSAGVTGQFIREEVFQFTANGFAFNMGLAASFLDERIRAGVSIVNLGEIGELDVESTTLPVNLRVGLHGDIANWSSPLGNDLSILLSLDFDYIQPLEDNPASDFANASGDSPFFNTALTARIADLVELKGGYKFGPTERPASFGTSFLITPLRINYALVPFTTGFDTVHSIGIQYYF